MLNDKQISLLIEGVRQASGILMGYYKNPDLDIKNKEDHSPVTEADMASHLFISKFLEREFPGIPLISEEAISQDYRIRKDNAFSWILDPLDGTREFIAANDEFAINLALLEKDKPVFGVISIPAKNLIYWALRGFGSWKVCPDGHTKKLPLQATSYQETRRIKALISRSHSGEAEKLFVKKMEEKGWVVEVCPAGSSYKHTLLAEGAAHLYAKPGTCWEWDTAAGQIILEEAGGKVVRMDNGEPLVYNKEVLLNPDLVMWAPGVSIPL